MSKPEIDEMGRTLRLTFFSDGFNDGQVPLTVLADKLKALQNLVFHATATVTDDRRGRSGSWANRYRSVSELAFADSHHSDLVIEVKLPEARDPDLFPAEQADVGVRALELVFDVGRAALDEGDLQAMIHDREDRLYLLKALESLCPGPMEDYWIELSNGVPRAPRLLFSPETRQKLRRRTLREKTPSYSYGEAEETIVGQLTKIHVHTRPQMVAVRVGDQSEVSCYFDESMLDQVSNLMPGSLVEVTGWPVVDASGRMQINAITDVDTLSMDPLRLTRFEHDGHQYRLREPVLILIEYTDGMWIYRNEDINLWGYARRRADAVKELGAAFDYLFREIALEDDAVLDSKAQLIKQRLLALVEQHNVKGP